MAGNAQRQPTELWESPEMFLPPLCTRGRVWPEGWQTQQSSVASCPSAAASAQSARYAPRPQCVPGWSHPTHGPGSSGSPAWWGPHHSAGCSASTGLSTRTEKTGSVKTGIWGKISYYYLLWNLKQENKDYGSGKPRFIFLCAFLHLQICSTEAFRHVYVFKSLLIIFGHHSVLFSKSLKAYKVGWVCM